MARLIDVIAADVADFVKAELGVPLEELNIIGDDSRQMILDSIRRRMPPEEKLAADLLAAATDDEVVEFFIRGAEIENAGLQEPYFASITNEVCIRQHRSGGANEPPFDRLLLANARRRAAVFGTAAKLNGWTAPLARPGEHMRFGKEPASVLPLLTETQIEGAAARLRVTPVGLTACGLELLTLVGEMLSQRQAQKKRPSTRDARRIEEIRTLVQGAEERASQQLEIFLDQGRRAKGHL